MSSFTKTIPASHPKGEIEGVLSREDHFVPLSSRPLRAQPGDFIYLVYRGFIVGRARISSIEFLESSTHRRPRPYPAWARCIIHYPGGWQRPPRPIPVQGHQGIRYLAAHGLEKLESEIW